MEINEIKFYRRKIEIRRGNGLKGREGEKIRSKIYHAKVQI